MKSKFGFTSGSPVLNMSVLMGTSLTLLGSIWAGLKEREHRADYPGFETQYVQTSTGNRLQLAIASPKATSAQRYVLVPGLSSSVSTLAGIGNKLAEAGQHVVLYNRAGYGGSVRLSEEPFHINEFVVDLYDSLEEIATDQVETKFHLVGHSLGGYLLHKFAHAHPEMVSAVSYLDPTHPNELQVSIGQRMGSSSVDLAVNTITPFVRFGASMLYRRGVLSYADGYQFRDRVFADLTSASVWGAARDEWKFLYPLMLDGQDIVALPNTIPTQVIAAGETLRIDPSQEMLYRDYSAVIQTIPGVGHQSMLTKANAQSEIVRFLNDYSASADHGDGGKCSTLEN